MNTVRCLNMEGVYRDVDISQLQFRPAVYAFIVHDNKLMTFAGGVSGTRQIPGGKIELGETIMEALCREIMEEIGIEIKSAELLCLSEAFLYADHKQEAYQAIMAFYVCTLQSVDSIVSIHGMPEITSLDWLPVDSVRPEEFHPSALDAVQQFLRRQKNV